MIFLTSIRSLWHSHHAEAPCSATPQEWRGYGTASHTTQAGWQRAPGQPDHVLPSLREGLQFESLSSPSTCWVSQTSDFYSSVKLGWHFWVCWSATGKVVKRRKRVGQTERWSNYISLISLGKQTEEKSVVRATQRIAAHLHQCPHKLFHLQPTTAKASAMACAVPFKVSFRLLPKTVSYHCWCLYVIVPRTKQLLKALQAVNLGILATRSLLLISLNLTKAIPCNNKTWRCKKAGKRS